MSLSDYLSGYVYASGGGRRGDPFCFTPGVSEIEELRFWSLRLDKVRQADYFCLKLL